jgi:peptidylprolyl isomerase/FKBP-type peptidyl-prolyl cis-trans isomerase FklB
MFRRIAAAVTMVLALGACHPKAQPKPPADVSAGVAFMANNSKQPGVVTLPDGLQYKIVTSGPPEGVKPRVQDEVKVNYEGRLATGTRDIFDSSFKRGEPAIFGLEGIIDGWTEALQLMRPGDEWILWVPPALGYGAETKGPIPGNSVLEFRIQVLGVLKHDVPPQQG